LHIYITYSTTFCPYVVHESIIVTVCSIYRRVYTCAVPVQSNSCSTPPQLCRHAITSFVYSLAIKGMFAYINF